MRKYKFTHQDSQLSEEQRQFYETNGYLIIRRNVSHKLLDEARDRFLEICKNHKDVGFTVMKDPSLKQTGVQGEYLINKIQDFMYDEVLWKYCNEKSITDIVEGIIGPNITAVHSMLINKPPDADPEASLHPVHQDAHYFPFGPTHKIVASWTAMEDIDEKNGCLYVVPGTHTCPLYKHDYPKGLKNKLYHGIQGLEVTNKVNVVMKKGDSVFFHPLLLHGSGPNTTKGFRKAISCHYADNDCHGFDVRGTSQEGIGQEVLAVLGSKFGVNPDKAMFIDFWKAKSRLVKGKPGNFQNYSSHL